MEERISEIEGQLNEIKHEDKIREQRIKRNEQSLQEIWDYLKRPSLCLIGVPESESSKIDTLISQLKELGKQEQTNSKAIRRQEITRIRAEINVIET